MFGISVPTGAAWINVGIFALAGCANLRSFRHIRDIYERWDIPQLSYHILGLVQIVVAVLLALPSARSWGVALAMPIIFGWIIMLLDHQQYWGALGLSFALAALVVVILDSASAVDPVHYALISR